MSEATEAQRVAREIFLKTIVPRGRRTFWVTSRLAEAMEDVDARAGEVLFEAGSPAEHYYFLVSGEVEMVRQGARGWPVAGPGLVGVLDIALERPHARAAVVKRDAHLLRLHASVWFDALEDSFEVTYAVLMSMAGVSHALHVRPPPAGGFAPPRGDAPLEIGTSIVDRILFLGEVPLLRGASTQPLTTLAEQTELVTLAAGDALFEAGAHCDTLYVVASGELEVTHAASGTGGRFRAGALVGGAASLLASRGGYAARAAEPSRVLAIRHDDYLDVMEEHFSVVRSAMGFIARDVDGMLEHDAAPARDVFRPR